MNHSTEPLSLSPNRCRERQRWVSQWLTARDIGRAVLSSPEHVQYFTGFRPHRLVEAIACIDSDGRCLLVAPNQEPDGVAADQIVTFPAQRHATLRQDQVAASTQTLADALRDLPQPSRAAIEFSRFSQQSKQTLGFHDSKLIDIEPDLHRRRRRKDDDELAMIRRAIDCTHVMYATAREIIEPGITELEVFNQLHAAAVRVAGEPLTAIGNDYQCNSGGGPPRPRAAREGELFVLDLGPAYRGYYADNCRTFAVNGKPTDEQYRAWELIVRVLEMVENTVRPGTHCRELSQHAQNILDEYRPGSFCHHLGHGFGLFPHEAPHLNPNWDDTFEEADVFTAEPGLYGPELKAGIRLEQNYRVTADGVERLTSFPLEL